MDTTLERHIRDTALRAAYAAGEVQLQCRQEAPVVDRLYEHDVKLEADRLSEEAIFEAIRTDHPDAAILSEESGEIEGTGDLVWIVDPLDGTMNYFYGQHHFCTCIACYRRAETSATGLESLGTPLVGVVYAPAFDELFLGLTGRGATLNGDPIRPQAITALRDAIVTTSFGSSEAVMQRMEGIVHRMLRAMRKVRIQGSCGLDLCGVANGRLSGLLQSGVRCWDFAAARIILEEAGATLDAEETGDNRWTVRAAAPGIDEAFRTFVASASAES